MKEKTIAINGINAIPNKLAVECITKRSGCETKIQIDPIIPLKK